MSAACGIERRFFVCYDLALCPRIADATAHFARNFLMKRRLATILVGDVVGYSAMIEADEEGTAARIAEVSAMVREKVEARDGRPCRQVVLRARAVKDRNW